MVVTKVISATSLSLDVQSGADKTSDTINSNVTE